MHELIQHQTLDASAASITFSNIPQMYQDLLLVFSARSDRSNAPVDTVRVRFNGSTTGYSYRALEGTGSGISSFTSTSFNAGICATDAGTASVFGNSYVYIPNYTNALAKVGFSEGVSENNATGANQFMTTSLWTGTDAITSLVIAPETGTVFKQHSSATLYGVNRTAAIGKPKAIGGNITYANGYWVHTFTGSGTFSTQEAIEVDALVVAGGGGTGFHIPGGGGAGGFLAVSSIPLTKGEFSVLVGSGGAAGATEGSPQGRSGSNSSFLSSVAIGGGYGGTRQLTPASGGSGGSGGGGGGAGSSGTATAGSGTSGQGNSGGNGYLYPDGRAAGGGGGGASAAGVAGSFGAGGAGGAGALWGGAYYAGGGGGSSGNSSGAGGIGGGGSGTNFGSGLPAGNGTANTGGGAGGGENGASGGSGVVIIRYRAD
jgi:hypothetical protein